MRINKILCLFLLTTTHFVVGMKKTVEKQGDISFRDKDGTIIPFAGKKALTSFIMNQNITEVHIPAKEYLKLLNKNKQETKKQAGFFKIKKNESLKEDPSIKEGLLEAKKRKENSLKPTETPIWKKRCNLVAALLITTGIVSCGFMNYTHR